MDHFSSSYSSSSSSSSSQDDHPPKIIKWAQPSYLQSLHSVRKPNQKPIMKKFIAPLPPTPPKIYKIDSSNFKEAVRALTSSPEFQSPPLRRLKDVAPPPLVLSTIPKPVIFPKPTPQPPPAPPSSEGGGTVSPLSAFTLSPDFCKFLNETLETSRFNSKSPVMDCFGGLSPLGSSLSPEPRAYDPFGVSLMSPLGFSLSPSSLTWGSSMFLSPKTLSMFNPSPIL